MKMTMIPVITGALGTITKSMVNRLEDLEITGQVETIPDYSIIKRGQNSNKSSRDLRRLAVTQTSVENHQLTLW